MQYRNFGRLEGQVSALGFGAMRLPVVDGDPAQVDQPEANRLIRYAIDQGVNYVDTAYPYHRGNGEAAVGRALQDGYRERVRLATKMPSWLVNEPGDFDRYFDEQLARLQTGYLDVYLLHALDRDRWQKIRDMGVLDWAEKQMAAGRIRHLGFSFHDTYECYQEIVDGYDNWALSLIHYNYLEEDVQAGTRGLRYAAAKGLAVAIMGPVGGGLLSANPPAAVQALWDSAPVQRSPAEWALQWVWNHPEVSVVLSGMSSIEQVRENLASAGASGANSLAEEELALVERARDLYFALRPVPCTECKYCQPCPNGVIIPDVFNLYNAAFMHNAVERSRKWYSGLAKDGHGGDQCLSCGECESACPQHIAIMEWLPVIHEYLGGS